jgi:aspartyl/glutamyl-tRNA(Asn/Gln) amidotransferase C subunit
MTIVFGKLKLEEVPIEASQDCLYYRQFFPERGSKDLTNKFPFSDPRRHFLSVVNTVGLSDGGPVKIREGRRISFRISIRQVTGMLRARVWREVASRQSNRSFSTIKTIFSKPPSWSVGVYLEESEVQEHDLTREELERLASLSKIKLKEDTEKVQRDMKLILRFVGHISKVDTSQVEPLASVLHDEPMRLREDQVEDVPSPQAILQNAKETHRSFFAVPKVKDLED